MRSALSAAALGLLGEHQRILRKANSQWLNTQEASALSAAALGLIVENQDQRTLIKANSQRGMAASRTGCTLATRPPRPKQFAACRALAPRHQQAHQEYTNMCCAL